MNINDIHEDKTKNREYLLPHQENSLKHDVERVRAGFDAVDADMKSVFNTLSAHREELDRSGSYLGTRYKVYDIPQGDTFTVLNRGLDEINTGDLACINGKTGDIVGASYGTPTDTRTQIFDSLVKVMQVADNSTTSFYIAEDEADKFPIGQRIRIGDEKISYIVKNERLSLTWVKTEHSTNELFDDIDKAIAYILPRDTNASNNANTVKERYLLIKGDATSYMKTSVPVRIGLTRSQITPAAVTYYTDEAQGLDFTALRFSSALPADIITGERIYIKPSTAQKVAQLRLVTREEWDDMQSEIQTNGSTLTEELTKLDAGTPSDILLETDEGKIVWLLQDVEVTTYQFRCHKNGQYLSEEDINSPVSVKRPVIGRASESAHGVVRLAEIPETREKLKGDGEGVLTQNLLRNLAALLLSTNSLMTYESPGTYSTKVPNGTRFIYVMGAVGGGGAGGGSSYSSGVGAGGNGGAAVLDLLIPVKGGESLTIVIGSGGNYVGTSSQGGNGTETYMNIDGIKAFSCPGGYGGYACTTSGTRGAYISRSLSTIYMGQGRRMYGGYGEGTYNGSSYTNGGSGGFSAFAPGGKAHAPSFIEESSRGYLGSGGAGSAYNSSSSYCKGGDGAMWFRFI